MKTINLLGKWFIKQYRNLVLFGEFSKKTFKALITTKLKTRQVLIQMEQIGVQSFLLAFFTGLISGFAIALQTYVGLSKFGGVDFLGAVVTIGMTRELGPLLTGIMVTGRAGSAMAAELGTMQITEQIDALQTLNINPYQYLIVPRVVASTVILPFLTILAMFSGITGGYLYSVFLIKVNPESFIASIRAQVELVDIVGGLLKSSIFGFILAIIGSFMGFTTRGGARNIGHATTNSVVVSATLILIANYLLNTLIFKSPLN